MMRPQGDVHLTKQEEVDAILKHPRLVVEAEFSVGALTAFSGSLWFALIDLDGESDIQFRLL